MCVPWGLVVRGDWEYLGGLERVCVLACVCECVSVCMGRRNESEASDGRGRCCGVAIAQYSSILQSNDDELEVEFDENDMNDPELLAQLGSLHGADGGDGGSDGGAAEHPTDSLPSVAPPRPRPHPPAQTHPSTSNTNPAAAADQALLVDLQEEEPPLVFEGPELPYPSPDILPTTTGTDAETPCDPVRFADVTCAWVVGSDGVGGQTSRGGAGDEAQGRTAQPGGQAAGIVLCGVHVGRVSIFG